MRGGTSKATNQNHAFFYFNPPTPCGVGLETDSREAMRGGNFNPPTPCGVGLTNGATTRNMETDFNPPTPCGVGPLRTLLLCGYHTFQSTHPLRGGTGSAIDSVMPIIISIHPPLAGWDSDTRPICGHSLKISIHPPLAGWDTGNQTIGRRSPKISIHPPLAGWDRGSLHGLFLLTTFQSTHPLRGGTVLTACRRRNAWISIHPPLAGWDDAFIDTLFPSRISIHPPLAGWDGCRPAEGVV